MKTLLRAFFCTSLLGLAVVPASQGSDPAGLCEIRCSDGTTATYSCVTYPRCRVRFNELCGGVGLYSWTETTTCP
jgi:hypothetical protein